MPERQIGASEGGKTLTSAKAWVAAIYAAIGSGLSALAIVLVGDLTLSDLSQAQWLAIAIAVFTNFGAAFGLTWATSNKPSEPVASVYYDSGE